MLILLHISINGGGKKQALFYHSVVYLLVNSFYFALIGKAVKLMTGWPYDGHI